MQLMHCREIQTCSIGLSTHCVGQIVCWPHVDPQDTKLLIILRDKLQQRPAPAGHVLLTCDRIWYPVPTVVAPPVVA